MISLIGHQAFKDGVTENFVPALRASVSFTYESDTLLTVEETLILYKYKTVISSALSEIVMPLEIWNYVMLSCFPAQTAADLQKKKKKALICPP